MKNVYLEHLKSLSKDQLISLLYKPYKNNKIYDFKSYRNVALKFCYHGKDYSGLAEFKFRDTIGNRIKNALLMSTLGDKIVYAGRTDAGVSAANMIGSCRVKSRLTSNTNRYEITDDDTDEFNYDLILNSYLPENIKILGWAPVEDEFSARFSCIQRIYRYYFFDEGYDFSNMNKMCKKIISLKNFYDFCKHSENIKNYNRTVDKCEIVKDNDLYYLDIRARSFLHNMVRKIFWVLDKIGRDESFSYSNVGISDPENLIFYEAIYPIKLNFLCKQKSNNIYQKIKIKNEILRQIYKEV
ncbi:trna pseudouridine synthase a [Vairimorpha apis BRL 01]|uniref:tRNA pseudouridine synthase n=1 Tax=Vairimorpha apis BRL 01 TaxID=1037528 RepID=T0LAV1_9MICR|nr:trna pseudouridine synthase a [Vairimorpha apis BRL 01]